MNDNYKKWNEMICQMLDKNYDVECTGCRDDIMFNHNFINSTKDIMFYKRYKNVKLINIMRLFEQFHFQTEDGKLLILPGRYIISILPVKNKSCRFNRIEFSK